MLNFNPYNILAGLVFGILGMASISYGKKLGLWKPVVIGIGLSVYPYFTSNVWATWIIGIALLVTLWFHHDE